MAVMNMRFLANTPIIPEGFGRLLTLFFFFSFSFFFVSLFSLSQPCLL